ncbi:MAG: M23 family metallopeptidase, partial [Bacteroidales bacterium]|nr:M23 family metallopeptidase [Bacteroidales bacterium]
NNGIDIGTTRGAICRAIFNGKVTGIVSIPGSNKAVIIRHGNYLTVYSNLAEVYVKMGENIKTKQSIGKVYTDPDDSKTELHFEIWNGKKTLDPSSWISRK